MRMKIKERIVWAVGAAIVLFVCFVLCRTVFFDLHGSRQWPVAMLITALAAVGIAAIFNGRKIMICTVLGYTGGFAIGIVLGVDGVDPGEKTIMC